MLYFFKVFLLFKFIRLFPKLRNSWHLRTLGIQFNEIDLASDKYRNAGTSRGQAISRSTLFPIANALERLPSTLCSTLQHEKILKPNSRVLGLLAFGPWIFYFCLKTSMTRDALVLLGRWGDLEIIKRYFYQQEYTEAAFTIRFDVIVKGKLRNLITRTYTRARSVKLKKVTSTDPVFGLT